MNVEAMPCSSTGLLTHHYLRWHYTDNQRAARTRSSTKKRFRTCRALRLERKLWHDHGQAIAVIRVYLRSASNASRLLPPRLFP